MKVVRNVKIGKIDLNKIQESVENGQFREELSKIVIKPNKAKRGV